MVGVGEWVGMWPHRWNLSTLPYVGPLPDGGGAGAPSLQVRGGVCGGSVQPPPVAQTFPGVPSYEGWRVKDAAQIWTRFPP